MGLLDLFGKKSDITVVQTPHGQFDLAKESDVKKLRTIAISVQRQSESLTRQEINNWRTGWQQALDVENPTRVRLYDVYRDTAIDGHLSGAIGQINGFVKARSFKIMKGEKEDEELKKIFDSIWFKTLMGFYFEARYWGHSLVQLGDVITTAEGVPAYDNVLGVCDDPDAFGGDRAGGTVFLQSEDLGGFFAVRETHARPDNGRERALKPGTIQREFAFHDGRFVCDHDTEGRGHQRQDHLALGQRQGTNAFLAGTIPFYP